MATDQPAMSVNGNFMAAQPQDYGMPDQTVTTTVIPTTSDPSIAGVQNSGGGAGGNTDIPKDEVGWYFVEQYYTTMSKNPEKLYLFYNKRSQYVYGTETEKVDVCIGQKAVNDRIRELDIQDCKVRVTNVDSQGSGQNIVIQVIGEMSNKSQPQRKFTQTFVLAEQTNGYFVLNDIFRYIMEDEEEEYEGEDPHRAQYEAATGYQEPNPTAAPEAEPHTLTNSQNASDREHDAQMVDQGLEQAIQQERGSLEAPSHDINGSEAAQPTAFDQTEDTTAAPAASVEPSTNSVAPEGALNSQEINQPEQPAAPESTPAISRPDSTPARQVAPAPPKPSGPKTWANMVAANNKPAASPQTSATPQAAATSPANTKTASAGPTFATQAPVSAGQDSEQPLTPQSAGSEWQTARHDHGKKQSRPQVPSTTGENSRAYIKNIGENIDQNMLRTILTKFGDLTYLDINRQKNCAFADFATPAAYQAAVGANPHEVGGERIFVEERRIRPQSFGGGFNPRGGAMSRGRGGMEGRPGGQGRGGFKDGNRGGFANRSRGNMNNPRGRGVTQAV